MINVIKNVVILTLSIKHGGLCIAAYDLNTNRILRLVKNNSRENAIPRYYVRGINLLDEVTIDVIGECSTEHQTENTLIDLDYGFRRTGHSFRIQDIYYNLSSYTPVFGDNNYRIMNTIGLQHSLEIVKFENMHFEEINDKTKATFYCNNILHCRYSITDPRYFGCSDSIQSGYAIISLPVSDSFTQEGGYYKYISAIYPD